ncbi:hypothetical protein PTKIN_Ptkin12aG0164400 [Pterospermum kingtungense]
MSSSGRKIILKSSEGELFEVDEAVALLSPTMMEADNVISLPKVTSEILEKVIDYCKKHAEAYETDADELQSWDLDFVNHSDSGTLLDLIAAAHDLKIECLVDLACSTIAGHIENKTREEIFEYFGYN